MRTLILLAALAAVPAAAAPAAAAPVHTYQWLDLSPSGSELAAVEPEVVFASATEPRGPIVIRSAADGRILRRLDPCKRCRYSGLNWSPDGTRLAFLASDAARGRVELDVAAGARVATLASVKGVANTPRWSPDGGSLAVLATLGAKKNTGALEAGAPQVGEIGAAPDEQRIAVVPAAGGPLRLVSPADTFVYEYDWLPDGRGFVVTAAKGDGDNNWWIAELALVELASGEARRLARPTFQISMPRAAPDGRSVVFIGGLMSDFGAVGGEIYEVPIGGGEPVSRTPGFRGSFGSLAFRAGELYAGAIIVDTSALVKVGRDGAASSILWSAKVSASTGDEASGAVDRMLTLSADGRSAATVVEDFGHPQRVLAGPVGDLQPITHDNDALAVELDVSSIEWQSDGRHVQGWLVGPAVRPPGRRYPMIVHVHGGPSAAVMPIFGTDYSFYTTVHEWVALGYYLFLPNPRGSYGQGEEFARANVRDFGGGDLKDILAGVDRVLETAPVDGARLGIHGHSYGGFMGMWAVTHTDRFKAAITGAGIGNWISYYGENGIDQWMIPFFGGSAYDDPAIYRKLSPLESIKQARTPTLIYVGELDVECPAPQSFEFWHGLKAMGVPTELVVYPGSGHLIHDPGQLKDLRRRLPEWFGRYLKP